MNAAHTSVRPWWLRRRWMLLGIFLLALTALMLWRYGDGDLRALDRVARAAGLPLPGDADWYDLPDPAARAAWERLEDEAERVQERWAVRYGTAYPGNQVGGRFFDTWSSTRLTTAVRQRAAEQQPLPDLEQWWSELAILSLSATGRGYVGYEAERGTRSIRELAVQSLICADQDSWTARAVGCVRFFSNQRSDVRAVSALQPLLAELRRRIQDHGMSEQLREVLEQWSPHSSDAMTLRLTVWKSMREPLGDEPLEACARMGRTVPEIETIPVLRGYISRWSRQQAIRRLVPWLRSPDAYVGQTRDLLGAGSPLVYDAVIYEQLFRYAIAYRCEMARRAVITLLLHGRLPSDPYAANGGGLRFVPAGSATGAIWSVGPDGDWDGGTAADLELLPAL